MKWPHEAICVICEEISYFIIPLDKAWCCIKCQDKFPKDNWLIRLVKWCVR
jgi:hypothetical protein